MPYTTLTSGLTIKVPTQGTSNWATTLLNENFQKISEHDHSGGGKGLPIVLASGSVTLAKLADIATDRLIGRDTAGTGVPEALTVGGGLEFSGSGGIQRSALTGDVTSSAGSNSTLIAANAVTTAKISDGNVTTAKIAGDAVIFSRIQNINTDRLLGRDTASSGDVEEISVSGGLEFSGSAAIQRSALTGDVTASAGSGSTTIASNAVTTAKILDANVTEAKLADDAATRSALLTESAEDYADGSGAITEIRRASTGTKDVYKITMPKACKVTHLSINLSNAKTSGTLVVTVYKNGSTSGQAITMATTTDDAQALGAAVSFAAGDELSLAVTRTSCVFSGGSTRVVGVAWGHFTE